MKHAQSSAQPGSAIAEVYLLNEKQTDAFEAALREAGVINEHYHPPIFPGCVAVHGDILDRAARTAMAFHRACKSIFDLMSSNEKLRDDVLRIFAKYPALRESVSAGNFFMRFFRIDFYLEEGTDEIRIIEANTSPGAFPEHTTMDAFLSKIFDCSPPPGFRKAHPRMTIEAFQEYWEASGKGKLQSMGLVAVDDGAFFPLAEANLYARELNSLGITPVFCKMEEDRKLSALNGGPLPSMQTLYHNPGGAFAVREAFTKELLQKKITLLPPRSNLLFTNKAFLSILYRYLDELRLVTEDHALLKRALLHSFDLHTWKEHEKEMRTWQGIVFKRDFGSSGNQVAIFPYGTHSWATIRERLLKMQRTATESNETWTIQRMAHPTMVSAEGKSMGFDIMVYTIVGDTPAVLFSSRPFTEGKANIVHGARYGQICRMD